MQRRLSSQVAGLTQALCWPATEVSFGAGSPASACGLPVAAASPGSPQLTVVCGVGVVGEAAQPEVTVHGGTG